MMRLAAARAGYCGVVTQPISHVNVVSLGDRLLVTWRGGHEPISVFVSSDPDDAGVEVFAPDSPGRALVPVGDLVRPYVHVFDPVAGFVVSADRHIEMDGPRNLRDLGGYPSSRGGATRWGRVFRSDRLDAMTDADHARILALGISKVFDLRAEAEVADAPDRLPDGVDLVRLPMSSDGARSRTIMERIEVGDLTGFGPDEMSDGYLVMLDEFTGHFATVLESVGGGETVMVHCTAGKDRTGIMAMVLLATCGVADAHLLDDYELSNSHGPQHGEHFAAALRSRGLDPDAFATLWTAPRPVMRTVLDAIRERWGGIDGYLEYAGIGGSAAQSVRHRMLYDEQV